MKFNLVAKILSAALGVAALVCLVTTKIQSAGRVAGQAAKLLAAEIPDDLDPVPTTDITDSPTATEAPSGLEDSVIAAIVVGCVVVIAIVAVIVYSVISKRRNSAGTQRRASVSQRVDEEAVAV